jgi:hypothetical protein
MIKAMKQALEALEASNEHPLPWWVSEKNAEAITALRQAIAEVGKEPVACGYDETTGNCTQNPCCYTHPQPKAEPIARVTGVYNGRFVVEPLNPAMVLPTNMALFAEPQPKAEQKRPQNCGTSFCSCIECVMEPEPKAEQSPLTDEEIEKKVEDELVNYWNGEYIDTTGARDCLTSFARAIEAAHGIGDKA